MTQIIVSTSELHLDHSGISVRTSQFDGCLQKVVLVSLQECILYAEQYPTVAGHARDRRTYDKMRKQFLRPHVLKDVYQMVGTCAKCARNRKMLKRKWHLHVFPESRPLEYIATNMLGPRQRTRKQNEFVIAASSRESKLTREFSLSKKAATYIVTLFLSHCIVPYRISEFRLTDNGPQFWVDNQRRFVNFSTWSTWWPQLTTLKPTDRSRNSTLRMSRAYGTTLPDTRVAGTSSCNRARMHIALKGAGLSRCPCLVSCSQTTDVAQKNSIFSIFCLDYHRICQAIYLLL